MPDPTNPLAAFLPVTRAWFEHTLGQPTPPQQQGWPAIPVSYTHLDVYKRQGIYYLAINAPYDWILAFESVEAPSPLQIVVEAGDQLDLGLLLSLIHI